MNRSESDEESERVPAELVFLHVHGSAERNPRRAGAGIVAFNKDGVFMFSIRNWLGARTRNQAEYMSLIIGLDLLVKWWVVKRLIVKSNSGLLVRQMRGDVKVRNNELRGLKDEVDQLIEQVGQFKIEQIPEEENGEAIRLGREGIEVIGAHLEYKEPDPSRIRAK
jgi:ribonuclease HI